MTGLRTQNRQNTVLVGNIPSFLIYLGRRFVLCIALSVISRSVFVGGEKLLE